MTPPPAGPISIPPGITFAAVDAEQVQREAVIKFQVTAFTSYIELAPEDSVLLLVLRRKNEVGAVATNSPTSNRPVTREPPQQMPLMIQLFTSPDFRSPLDPSAKVQRDRRIYAEVSQPVSQ